MWVQLPAGADTTRESRKTPARMHVSGKRLAPGILSSKGGLDALIVLNTMWRFVPSHTKTAAGSCSRLLVCYRPDPKKVAETQHVGELLLNS